MVVRRPVVALLMAVAACSSCGGDDADADRVSTQDLPAIVLQPADLPDIFARFDEGELTLTDLPVGERADPRRFGRLSGWKARYRRPGSAQTRGPLVVESRVDVFDDEDGAVRELALHRKELAAAAGARALSRPAVGDESVAVTRSQGGGSFAVRYFTIAWRHANVTASVSVNGFEGRLALGDGLKLARKQDRRIGARLGP